MLMMNTGHTQVGRPSIGSWLTYGLGTENQNLPGYVVLCPDVPTTVGPPLWNSAFLPAVHQGTFIPTRSSSPTRSSARTSIRRSWSPTSTTRSSRCAEQRRELDLLDVARHACSADGAPADPQLDAAIESMETAYRMQTEAPDVFDIRKESKATLELYGPGSTARGCLMAVRLVEHGVRMVQVYYAKGDPWDAHADIQAAPQEREGLGPAVRGGDQGPEVTRPVRGHAGRLRLGVRPHAGGGSRRRRRRSQNGRDHNPFGFTMWLAGGGVKGGTVYGATDDFGFKAVEKPVHVHDLHATILHLLGIDHTKLTYRYSGRDFRLTDVVGQRACTTSSRKGLAEARCGSRSGEWRVTAAASPGRRRVDPGPRDRARPPRPGSRSSNACRRRTACSSSGRSGTARTAASAIVYSLPFQSTSFTSSPSTSNEPFCRTLIVAIMSPGVSAARLSDIFCIATGSRRWSSSCPSCRAAAPSPRPATAD